jgi:hypothetical protein
MEESFSQAKFCQASDTEIYVTSTLEVKSQESPPQQTPISPLKTLEIT